MKEEKFEVNRRHCRGSMCGDDKCEISWLEADITINASRLLQMVKTSKDNPGMSTVFPFKTSSNEENSRFSSIEVVNDVFEVED